MSDIVERLRNGEPCRATSGVRCRFMDARYGCLCAIAADEITRLTAENEKLRAALWDIHAICNNGPFVWAKRIRAIARVTLRGRQPND